MTARGLIAGGALLGLILLLLVPAAQTGMVQDDNQAIKDRAQASIQKGLSFLRRAQARSGAFPYLESADQNPQQVVGATALCGIAMLECDVGPGESSVQNAAAFVRRHVDSSSFNYNYSVALSIMFLERLSRGTGKTTDANLIKRLASMIVRAQGRDGGWGYQLTPGGSVSDNSNTQFAIVALWLARKSGVPGVDAALAGAAQKFRKTQKADGAWTYDPASITSGVELPHTGAMTAAGTLGLALHAGIVRQQANFRAQGNGGEAGDVVVNLNVDPAVIRAREYLVTVLMNLRRGDLVDNHPTYFLWSLERVCKLYRWKKINELDWFAIGVNYLLPKQTDSGAWNLDHISGPTVDTAFALLFLAQSNLLGALEEAEFKGGKALTSTTPVAPIAPSKAETKAPKQIELAKDLAKKLANARPEERTNILEEFELAKGSDYSYELAKVIPDLPTNQSKDSAREILNRRMARLSVKTLSGYAAEDDRELRLAATRGAGLKNDKGSIPTLIPLLSDRDINVQEAALSSLKSLSNQNFGKSVERWSKWYETTQKK
jgi:hypothetical protein